MPLVSGSTSPAALQSQRRRAVGAALAALGLACLPWSRGRAQAAARVAEYKLKAAFLYKFASYVEWPPQVFEAPDSPLLIGVVDSDPLSEELAAVVAGRTVGARTVSVHKLAHAESLGAMHIAFIGRPDSAHFSDFVASARGHPVLTVTESDGAFPPGSIINFVIVEDKLRFDVALHAAELAKLKLSARLLSVARRVMTGPS